MFTHTIMFFLTITTDSPPTWVPPELLNASTFEMRPPGPGRKVQSAKSFVFVEKATKSVIQVGVGVSTPERATKRLTMFATSPTRTMPASSIPLGRQTRVVVQPGHVQYHIVENRESAATILTSPKIEEGRWRTRRPDNLGEREGWVEALTRQAMGRFAARRAGAIRSRTIGGRAVPVFTASETNAEMADLNAWAAARSVELNHNLAAHRASFSWRGQSHLAALATDKIKVGGTWRSMPDIVMEHQGKLWVPLEALE